MSNDLHPCVASGCHMRVPAKSAFCTYHWNLLSPASKHRIAWLMARVAGGRTDDSQRQLVRELIEARDGIKLRERRI